MDPHFSIVTDEGRSYIHITISGFFGLDDVGAYIAERDRVRAGLRRAHHDYVALIDIREADTQSQEAVQLFRSAAVNGLIAARRLAVVVAKSLNRMQMRRIIEGRDAAFFSAIDEAEEWLFSDRSVAA